VRFFVTYLALGVDMESTMRSDEPEEFGGHVNQRQRRAVKGIHGASWLSLVCLASLSLFLVPTLPAHAQMGVPPLDGPHADRVSGAVWSYLDTIYYNTEKIPASRRVVDREPIIKRASEGLRLALDNLAAEGAGGEAFTGLRVYYTAITGLHDRAVDLAKSDCTVGTWWCSATLGFAYHNNEQFPEAEAAFDSALALMPPERRCLWDDLSHVLNDKALEKAFAGLNCVSRMRLTQQLWWLAQPLWSMPGNERRTEHYSRWFSGEIVRMLAQIRNMPQLRTDVMSDPLNYLLRFGEYRFGRGIVVGCLYGGRTDCPGVPNSGWVMRRRYVPYVVGLTPFATTSIDQTLMAVPPGFNFAEGADVRAPLPWGLQNRNTLPNYERRAGQEDGAVSGEAYVSVYGTQYAFKDAQTALLLRRESLRLVAAFDFLDVDWDAMTRFQRTRGDAAGSRIRQPWLDIGSFETAIVVRRSPSDSGLTVRREAGDVRPQRFLMDLPSDLDSAMVSLEGVAARVSEAVPRMSFRRRFSILRPDLSVTGNVRCSDLVFYETSAGAPVSTEHELLRRMLARSTLPHSSSVGLYWELYGVPALSKDIEFELTVRSLAQPGFFRRAAQAVGLATADGETLVRWRGIPVSPETERFSVFNQLVDVSSLRPGDYELVLTSRIPDQQPIRARKVFRVE
jgi:hypothetical protein